MRALDFYVLGVPGLVLSVGREREGHRRATAQTFTHTHKTGNPYVYELYHNLLELLEAQGRPRHGVNARLIR